MCNFQNFKSSNFKRSLWDHYSNNQTRLTPVSCSSTSACLLMMTTLSSTCRKSSETESDGESFSLTTLISSLTGSTFGKLLLSTISVFIAGFWLSITVESSVKCFLSRDCSLDVGFDLIVFLEVSLWNWWWGTLLVSGGALDEGSSNCVCACVVCALCVWSTGGLGVYTLGS